MMAPTQPTHGTTRNAPNAGEEPLFAAVRKTSFGPVLVAASRRGIRGVEFGHDAAELETACQSKYRHASSTDAADTSELVDTVVEIIESPAASHGMPLDLRGTNFQLRVWEALIGIPVGETLSYLELARKLGIPKATRAVASACAANRIAVLVPCHRVVRSDGGLGGYRWGIDRKRELLVREAEARRIPMDHRVSASETRSGNLLPVDQHRTSRLKK